MNGIELNIFQSIFTSYSETTGYGANIFLLFFLAIAIGAFITIKMGGEGFLDGVSTMVISMVLVGFFTVFVLDVKGLNQERKELIEKQKAQKELEKKNRVYSLLTKIREDKKDGNTRLDLRVNETIDYLIENDENGSYILEELYDSRNFKLSLALMKAYQVGSHKVFRDQKKANLYKVKFLNEVCPNSECAKSKINQLNSKEIEYIKENDTFIFNSKERIYFYQALDLNCKAARAGYSISKDIGNSLAKKYKCVDLYNRMN